MKEKSESENQIKTPSNNEMKTQSENQSQKQKIKFYTNTYQTIDPKYFYRKNKIII